MFLYLVQWLARGSQQRIYSALVVEMVDTIWPLKEEIGGKTSQLVTEKV